MSESPPFPGYINWHGARLQERHGTRVWRLGLDAGFSCPHRSPDRTRGGCRFCASDGNLAAYQKGAPCLPSLEQQIARALLFTRLRYKASAFFLYFQAFSCTFAPLDRLKTIYDEAIATFSRLIDAPEHVLRDRASLIRSDSSAVPPGISPHLKGLVISTRPDCFNRDTAELLASYQRKGLEIWIEFGLQTIHASSLWFIRREHGVETFIHAMNLAQDAGLHRAVHLILGIPGESRTMMLETVALTASLNPEGIKLHDLKIVQGSAFARMFTTGELALLHPSRLPSLLADCLERLPPQTEIMRITSDFQPDELLALYPAIDKHKLARLVQQELEQRRSWQGKNFLGQ
ncbi:MAG: radical SAM protein [Spirochaetales bacterium]|nr:radical SAM protein [Spirochaetales bacterium]